MEKGQSNSAQIISPIVMLDLCTLRFFLSLSGEIPFCDVDLMKKTCSAMLSFKILLVHEEIRMMVAEY